MAVKFPYQNQVIVTGRLTRDPEFRYTQKGVTVCFFDIASNRRYKDNNTQEWKEDTTFIPVIAWGPIADRCKDRIKKGTPVYIDGRLSTSEYVNKEGVKIKRLRVVVNKIQILETSEKDDVVEEEVSDSIVDESLKETGIVDDMDDVPF